MGNGSSRRWAETAAKEYRRRNGGKLEAKEPTKADLEAVIELYAAEVDRLKGKVRGLQKAVKCQNRIFKAIVAILKAKKGKKWIMKNIGSLMEKEA